MWHSWDTSIFIVSAEIKETAHLFIKTLPGIYNILSVGFIDHIIFVWGGVKVFEHGNMPFNPFVLKKYLESLIYI